MNVQMVRISLPEGGNLTTVGFTFLLLATHFWR